MGRLSTKMLSCSGEDFSVEICLIWVILKGQLERRTALHFG